ncbi:MAG TPA: dual specificity protein phosphatase [Candidatus Lokiarchaeia archaeon]|nr:dual specificity protein phosphatase [Candidatus Lokiarchaeia archaeon]
MVQSLKPNECLIAMLIVARIRSGNVSMVLILDEILDHLFIGDEDDARNGAWLKKNNIRAIINCTTRVENCFEGQGIAYLRLMLEEWSHITPEIAAQIHAFVREHRPKHGILVHCAAGMQRAPAIVIVILLQDHYKFFDAFELVEKKRSGSILPTYEMLASIAQLDLNGEHVDDEAIKQYYRERFRLYF